MTLSTTHIVLEITEARFVQIFLERFHSITPFSMDLELTSDHNGKVLNIAYTCVSTTCHTFDELETLTYKPVLMRTCHKR